LSFFESGAGGFDCRGERVAFPRSRFCGLIIIGRLNEALQRRTRSSVPLFFDGKKLPADLVVLLTGNRSRTERSYFCDEGGDILAGVCDEGGVVFCAIRLARAEGTRGLWTLGAGSSNVFRALLIDVRLLGYVSRVLRRQAPPTRHAHIVFAVLSAVDERLQVLKRPLLASRYAPSALTAAAFAFVEDADSHPHWDRRVVGVAFPFANGSSHGRASTN